MPESQWDHYSVPELEALVRKHNELYFKKQKLEISDEAFDQLVEVLKKKNPNSTVLQEVGSDVESTSKTVRHKILMLSLDKCYTEKDLLHWASKFEGDVFASPKIDGCAVALHYDSKGKLYLALTRGSGVEGEVITKNIQTLFSVPRKIRLKNVEVRGEVYMPLSVFEKFRDQFANPRNLAAGVIKLKESQKTANYHLSFFAYDLLGGKLKTEGEKRLLLEKEGFCVVEGKKIPKNKMTEVFQQWFEQRLQHDFETDGVVYKVNSIEEQERLGATAHHPRFAIAYKFQGDFGETFLREVLWSVSRTGTITPIGVVDPVSLSGAEVSRVSLHNFGLMKKMGFTPPSKILMVRSGGVIPKVEKVLESIGRAINPPKHCPSCGSIVLLKEDFLYCSNPKKCGVSKIAELDHFVKVVGIDGFGRKHLKQLYEKGLVEDPADFYTLKVEDLVTLERMGKILAEKLVKNIQARTKLPLDVFLRSLGIPELGRHIAKILAEFGSLSKIGTLSKEDLTSIHTIGEKTAMVVIDGLKNRKAIIDRLLEFVAIEKISSQKEPGPLQGKTFLFTGALLAMTRLKAEEEVEKRGGMIMSGVSKNLDYLVVGDGGGAGSKLDKAKKLQQSGVTTRILNEKKFLKMIH